MLSTFHGLETARRGMKTQQYALQTLGHNIANANTPGYTRQRVNFSQTETYPSIAMNRPQIPGFLGTGVEASSVQRVREQFLDVQFRNENNKNGYYQTSADALGKIEDIINEPSEVSLSYTIDQFWQSLQDMSTNPQDPGARAVVLQRGNALAETFNYTANSIATIRNDYQGEIDNKEKEINTLLLQINDLNRQIGDAEPHGYVTNDLYDKRDVILDRLSSLVNIKTDRIASGGKADPAAEGKMNVWLVDGYGNQFSPPVNLVNGNDYTALKEFGVTMSGGLVSQISITNVDPAQTAPEFAMTVDQFKSPGSFAAVMEAYGYVDAGGAVRGSYPQMLTQLDEMAYRFATEFNKVHEAGWSLSEIENKTKVGYSFFRDSGNPAHDTASGQLVFDETADKAGFASRIAVADAILSTTNNIAAATETAAGTAFAGDGSNALLLANVKDMNFSYNGKQANVQSYYRGFVGDLAVSISEASRLASNTNVLKDNVQSRRDSISNVSIDEEMTNMIKYQHAYNAAARQITMIDEMLDRIINGMGRVGR